MIEVNELRIDIATKVLRQDDDVYVVRPGEGYWAFDHMRKSSRIFLDFPDLKISPGSSLPSDDQLRLHIVRSMAIRDWHDNDMFGLRPSDEPSDFDGDAYRRRLGRYIGALKRLLFELQPGTIVVVPDEGYFGQVLIGEIVGGAHVHSWTGVYDGDPLICRRVKWARSKMRGTFGEEVRDLLGHTTPVLQLPRSLRSEIMFAGYDQFAFSDAYTARLNTEEQDFSTLDDLSIQSFLNYVTGLIIAGEQGITEQVSYNDAIALVRQNPQRAMELQLNINSPGFQRLIDQTVAPLAAAVLLTIAVTSADPSVVLAQETVVELVNSKTVNDDCVIEVAERVANARDRMMIDDWERLCREMNDVRESTGISTTMKLDEDNG